ncbi:hypothetical protein BDV93DRAFT_526413, partial [Ceratobasidium sp. AG-I]
QGPSQANNVISNLTLSPLMVAIEGISNFDNYPITEQMQSTLLEPLAAFKMVPLSNDSLWDGALIFLSDHYRETEIREAVKERLLRWERLPTELGLFQLMAEFEVPQRWPRIVCGVPEYAIRLGDIGIAGWSITDWRSIFSQHSDQPGILTTTVRVWNNEGLVSSGSNPTSGWQSYFIGVWEAQGQYKVVVSTSNENNKAGDRAMWHNLQQRCEEVANFHDVERNKLEIVVNIKRTAKVSCITSEEMPKNLYFHRQPESFNSTREFWGFFSFEADPDVESAITEEWSETHLQTLPLRNSWDQVADDMLTRELGKIPGSFPSS